MKKITLLYFLLAFGLLQAQPVSGYQFVQSSETYVAVSGTNATAVGDDGTQNDIAIGFPFFFGGATYSTFSISTNGFIRLGNAVGPNNWINVLGNTAAQAPFIAAFWDDNNRNGGSIQYLLSGVSPNQILEVGWNQVNIGNNGQPNNAVSASYKIRLHESGTIEMIYAPQMTWSGGVSASIGINDLTSFLSITPADTSATASAAIANNAILATTDIAGKKYVFTPTPSCSGMPVPGVTIASTNAICEGHELVLSVENASADFGLSYQWQSSPDGVVFTDIAGAATAQIIIAQTVETTYQCVVTCEFGTSATTTPVTIAMTTTNCYCFPSYTFGKTDGDLISNIAILGTTLSNNTGTNPENPSYTYFSGQPNYTAVLDAGTTYEIQVTAGTYGQQHSAVWVDFNDDLIFGADERIGYTTVPTGSLEIAAYEIALACDAPAGIHRMRVRDVWNLDGIDIEPCANYAYGETEDYDITIATQTTCPVAIGLIATSVGAYSAQLKWEIGCGHASWDLYITDTGALPANPTYPNVTSPFIASNLTALTSYEFYVLAHCMTTGDSTWSGPFAFTTAAVPVANDECSTSFTLQVGTDFDQHALVATNVGATKSLGHPEPDCAAFNFGGDIWYAVTAPASGNLTVETRLEADSPVADTGLALYSGDCTTLTAFGCNDDDGDGAFSKMTLTGLTPGTTFYARVWEYANDALGAFRISAWDATLGNGSFDDSAFAYYPNPVRDILNLSYDKNISEVTVFNILGQQLISKKIESNTAQIDVSKLQIGTYVVKVTSGNQVKIIKAIKE